MAARLGWPGEAFAPLTRVMTWTREVLVDGVQRGRAAATRFYTSVCEALPQAMRRWLKLSSDEILVVVETEVENLGTQQVPIHLPRISTKHDLVVFDYIGP